MSFSKVYGPITISESAGKASIAIAVQESIGEVGGTNIVTANLSANASLDAANLIDAGIEIIASKFPSLSTEIAAFKALINAEIAKA